MDHFGPIRDTIKSNVAATGIEKIKNAGEGSLGPHVNSMKSPLN